MKNDRPWWKRVVFYQIYMPSFCDGNKDGIGDFVGITSKLHYLKELGIGGVWLTPFYPSPKVDNGYDISDYKAIDPAYGTMENFDEFIKEAHRNGIKVIIDMVLNHTSSEHQWFKESRSSLTSPKRNWYIWRKPIKEGVPNNWESFFGGSAWEYDETTGEYYYHSFAKEQVDLNWSNEELRLAMSEALQFWIDKGIDGFRLDVINNLTLQQELKNNPYLENGEQNHLYDVNQEGIHETIKEIKQFVNKYQDKFLVGEISSDDLKLIRSYAGKELLDTTFNFNLGSKAQFEINDFYQEISLMKDTYIIDYPTLFFGSHDMSRYRSRFQLELREVKLLAAFMLCFRGVPFIYYGEEIGMEDRIYLDIKDAMDIQGNLAYHQALKDGKTVKEALFILNKKGRDKSRNIMQWSEDIYGGFSTTNPWLPPNNSFNECNVASQKQQSESIYTCYRKLIKLRNEFSALQTGELCNLSCEDGIISFVRVQEDVSVLIMLNFTENEKDLSDLNLEAKQILYSSIYDKTDYTRLERKEALIVFLSL